MRTLRAIPWYVPTLAVTGAAIALAVVTNVLVGPYFERSFLNEASPLVALDDHAAPTQAATDTTPAATPPVASMAGVLAQGDVRDGEPGHNGEGLAKIIRTEDGDLVLRFEDFSVTNGPDLFVVLSPEADGYADGSLNLGGLKATDGNINYAIPRGTDLGQYRSAVIWCRSFDVTFAVATLMEAM